MKPYYQHAGITIYHGDAHEILPQLEYNVIVADPPYGVGKAYGSQPDTLDCFEQAMRLIISRRVPSAVFVPVCRLWVLPSPPQWLAVWSKTYCASALIAYPIYPHWEGIALYSFSGNYAGNQGHRSDVFSVAPAIAAGSGHPTPKPIALMKELCAWMPQGLLVDPFMGSGTTLEACKNLHRAAIGIEIEEKYCEVAAKRLAQEVLAFDEA